VFGRGTTGWARPVVVAGAMFWLGIIAIVAVALERERHHALANAEQEMATLAAVVQESTGRTFDNVDIALASLADELSRHDYPRNDASLRALMRARLKQLPAVRALYFIGPDGWIWHDTDFPTTPHVPLADRDYFRQYLRDPHLEHALSPALQSRSGAGWFVASTRRVTGPGGRFKGVVVAAVQLDWLAGLFNRLKLQPGQTLSLLQADGRLLARHPLDDSLIGRSYAQRPLFAGQLLQRPAGVYLTDGAPLSYPRIVSYHWLDTQPLVVALTLPLNTVLAAWYRTLAGAAGGVVLFTLLTAAGMLFFVQKQEEGRRAVLLRIARADAAAAAEANAKFRTFFEQGCFFCVVLALDGTVMEANQGGLDACGIGRHDVVGRKLWDCGWWGGTQAHGAAMQDALATAVHGTTAHLEVAYQLASGARTLMELSFAPVKDAAGALLSVAVLGVDITVRKHQEERLRRLADELSNADRLKGEFLATLSHELRNVLAPLLNAVGILDRVRSDAPSGVRARQMLHNQLAQMRRLVDDLLDVSRVNSGKIRLEFEQLDLREVLTTAMEVAQPLAEVPGHALAGAWPDEPLPVRADRARLQQVFSNLLGNAVKYTPPGGHIQMKARREGREAVVEVVDDGMGIPIEAQAKVFKMFEQVSDNLSRAQGGLGIGLALVQKLVALHGGHVEAYSEGSDRGSTFTVYLPLVPTSAPQPALPTDASSPGASRTS
jgi:PAS domain S-box-containing protein